MSALIQNRARGYTLVEMLVTLVVMAVGMLGIAALYVTSLRAGSGSIFRMQAVSLAGDIADRIRANRNAKLAYGGPAVADASHCALACAPDAMAANDLAVWQKQIAASLPAGAGTISVAQAGAMYTYQIQVKWSEPGENQRLSYTLNFQL